MKPFDAVQTMREIRTQLSERYKNDVRRQFDDLRRICEKYSIPPSHPSMKRHTVVENKAKYGESDSE